MRRKRAWCLICSAIAVQAMPAFAKTAPIVVSQNNSRNISRVIEQVSSVVNIDTSRTATDGGTTVSEVVRIGPEPAPVVVSQTGRNNRAVTYQGGRNPQVRLQQVGDVDSAVTIQREMP